jgi:SagB-type dehydrogenase family enzyme
MISFYSGNLTHNKIVANFELYCLSRLAKTIQDWFFYRCNKTMGLQQIDTIQLQPGHYATSCFFSLLPCRVALAILSCCWACSGHCALAFSNSKPPVATSVDLYRKDMIRLPQPHTDGHISVERALKQRRSVRDFSDRALSLEELGQLLWSAQGITHPEGLRTAPSAGALYPLELYVVVGNVTGLSAGVYRYVPNGHNLASILEGDRRANLTRAALGQSWMKQAPAMLVFGAVEARTTRKYSQRGVGYVYIEVGHAAQNVFLQAEALGLGAAVVGAFDDAEVAAILQMPKEEKPLYLMPVGKPFSP